MTNTKKLVLSAVLLAMGLTLPFLTMQIKEIGDSLLPMHLPVLLCGLLCGKKYGAAVGCITPLLRSAIWGMPPMYPGAVYMAAELLTYGFVSGFVYEKCKKHTVFYTYLSLISAMLAGRIVWGLSKTILLGLSGKGFSFALFIAGGFTDALPGIVLQLVLIPVIVQLVQRKRG